MIHDPDEGQLICWHKWAMKTVDQNNKLSKNIQMDQKCTRGNHQEMI